MSAVKFWLCRECQHVFDLPEKFGKKRFGDLDLTCPRCASGRTCWATDAADFLAAGGSPAIVCAELDAEDAQSALPELSAASLDELHRQLQYFQSLKNKAIEDRNYRFAGRMRNSEKAVLHELEVRQKKL